MLDIFCLVVMLDCKSYDIYPSISDLDNYDPTFDNYRKSNKKDEDSEMSESSTLNTFMFSKNGNAKNKIEFDFGKNEESEKEEFGYEKSKKIKDEDSDKEYDYIKKSSKSIKDDKKLIYTKNKAYNNNDSTKYMKNDNQMYGNNIEKYRNNKEMFQNNNGIYETNKNTLDHVNHKKLFENNHNKPFYSRVFLNTSPNKNTDSILFAVNPPTFANNLHMEQSDDIRPTFAFHNSEEPYESSDQNETIRSITRGKINTSPKNLNNVLHKELGDVSPDVSDKVEQAIRNVSKLTPNNYKEIIIIKKRILSDGKTKVVNLNVREKVVPKTKIEDSENDFGTRALIGGVLFLIAGLIFTTSLKIYQTRVKQKFIKKDVKDAKK